MNSHECENLWRRVVESKSIAEEHSHIEAFTECARKTKMGYLLNFERRGSTEQIPADEVARATFPLTVHMHSRSGEKLESWNPIDNSVVLVLFRE